MNNKMVTMNEKELEKVNGGFVITGTVLMGGALAALGLIAGVFGTISELRK